VGLSTSRGPKGKGKGAQEKRKRGRRWVVNRMKGLIWGGEATEENTVKGKGPLTK